MTFEFMRPLGDRNVICSVLIMGCLYNEKFHDFFSLSDAIRVIKSRRVEWAD